MNVQIAVKNRLKCGDLVTQCFLSKLLYVGYYTANGYLPTAHDEKEKSSFLNLQDVEVYISDKRAKGKSWALQELPLIVVGFGASGKIAFGGFEQDLFERTVVLPRLKTMGALWDVITSSNKDIHVFRCARNFLPARLPLRWLRRGHGKNAMWAETEPTYWDAGDAIKKVSQISLWLNAR